MVKKLRYYARFIVVSLLLKKTKQVRELIHELNRQINDYIKVYDPDDQLEWQLVKNEINDFIEADSIVTIEDAINVSFSSRLNPAHVPIIGPELFHTDDPYSKKTSNNRETLNNKANLLTLQEIIISGNCQNQIKFSELSLDMFRMLQAVEREPCFSSSSQDIGTASTSSGDKSPGTKLFQNEETTIIERENPHKYLLYKPTFSQFNTYIASAFKDLPPHGVMMVYLSADNCEANSKIKDQYAYDFGGVRTNNKISNHSSSIQHFFLNFILKIFKF
jgi:hypothetical protein